MISEVARMIRAGQGGITVGKARQMIQTILPMADRNQKRKLENFKESIALKPAALYAAGFNFVANLTDSPDMP